MSAAHLCRLLCLVPAFILAGCISHEPRQLVPSISLSPDNSLEPAAAEPRRDGVDFGFSASAQAGDSPDNLAVLPGVTVRSVRPGGPADTAGILPGDVILSLDGQPVSHPDLLDAIAVDIDSERNLRAEVRRDTTVFTTILRVSPASDAREEPVELYRADPVALRAGFTTERLEDRDGEPVSGARIVRLFPESPLPGAGLDTDDIILSVDGRMVGSAQGLVDMIHNRHEPGDRITLAWARDNRIRQQTLELWHPGTRLARLSLWPLFVYESSLSPDRTRLRIGDLWLFSLFSYERRNDEREYSVLGLFRTATGYGELLEE